LNAAAHRRTILLILAVAAAGSLTGCADTGDSHLQANSNSDAAWADEFASAMLVASEYERSVLEDGVITPAELADAQSKKRSCLEEAGYRWDIEEDGTSSLDPISDRAVPPAQMLNGVLQECSRRFDQNVTVLFDEVRRNPQHEDEARIMVSCLRDAGLVDESYAERDWRRDDDRGVYPFSTYDEAFVDCRLDPLRLWRKG
jgi:hypothetical protein